MVQTIHDGFEPRFASGDEHDVIPIAREEVRELLAETGRCAGDEGHGTFRHGRVFSEVLSRAAMSSLPETLNDPAKKPKVVDDCLVLIDQEVSDKGGLTGLAIKAGYAAVKGVKPGFIRDAVNSLLPEFAVALDPVFQEAKTKNVAVSSHFVANQSRVADALLTITDEKARKSPHGVVKGAYDKLRGTAKKNVEAAVPRLGRLIEKHSS